MPEQYQPVDGDPFAASAVSLQPVFGDPFATGSVNPQTTPQGSMPYDLQGQSISAYNPTWRERAAQWLYGDQPRSPEAQATIRGLVGTTGLGTPQMSVSDLTPAGGVFGAQEAARRGDYSGAGIAAMSVLPGAGVIDRGITEGVGVAERAGEAVLGSGPIRQAAEKLEPVTGDPFTPITAYHGSPHDFDAFDMSKIGTGEGAQAYGHGLYFAGNEGVARQYRDNLSRTPLDDLNSALTSFSPYTPNGPPNTVENIQSMLANHSNPALKEASNNPNMARDLSVMTGGHDLGDNTHSGAAVEAAKRIDKYFENQSAGKMYQVQINADPNHFLDWDKPLSEQHPVVQQGLQSLIGDTPMHETAKGSDWYWQLNQQEKAAGAPATQSGLGLDLGDKLKQAGIPGIKYLDAGSRGSGTGTSNYVVFDDKIINILKKYGIGGLGIGTAAGLSHFKTQPVNGDPYSNQPD